MEQEQGWLRDMQSFGLKDWAVFISQLIRFALIFVVGMIWLAGIGFADCFGKLSEVGNNAIKNHRR